MCIRDRTYWSASAGQWVQDAVAFDLWVVLDDLLAAGINGLQGLEPGAAMTLAGVRERVGPCLLYTSRCV